MPLSTCKPINATENINTSFTYKETAMQESEGAAQANIADSIIRWETISCDLCGASDSERLLDGIDWEFGLNALLRLVRCSKCGLVYLNPRPTLSSIPLIYPPSYGYYKESSRVRRLLKLVYYKITTPYPYLDGVKPGRILDVGCGTGSTRAFSSLV